MIVELWREEDDSHQHDSLSLTQNIYVDKYLPVKHLSNHKKGVKAQTQFLQAEQCKNIQLAIYH